MSSPLTRLQARIAGQLARERMGERFAAQVNYEATPVAGAGLARVDGQLVDSTVGEEKSAGDLVAMANVGRPAAAIYSPQGGAAVVIAAAATSETGGGVTVHGQLSGLGADDHAHYLNIERGDARYYTEPEEDAWRAAHIALPDIHHNHATAGAPLTIDGGQYISLLYNSTLLKDGGNKLGVNLAYNFAWTNSHNWAMDTTLSSAGVVIPPGIAPGYGWSLVNPTSGDATLTIPNIYVGNLHAQAFIADVARADVGEEVWTRSRAVLAADLQLPEINETVDLVVEVPPGIDPALMDLFGANHYVRLRIFDTSQGLDIADAWGTVTRKASLDKASVKGERPSAEHPEGVAGAPAEQGYLFKLLKSDAAADSEAVPPKEGAIILAGALAMDYGLPGDAFVFVTVIKAGSPYTAYYRWGINLADGSVRSTAHAWEGQYWKLLTRIGNLEGQVDTAFGGALHGAGLYSENVYLKGRIVIAAGSDVPWGAVSGSGKPQDNATYGSPWDLVTGTGKPQDNATYGSPWDLVTGAGKPQDNATRGATWNVDMVPPGYLKAPGSTPGLYMTGTELGYWNGVGWNTYLDSGGNFVFAGGTDTPVEGSTMLAYFAGKDVVVNNQTVHIPATLAGKKWSLAQPQEIDQTYWHKTWWADNATGALHAGPGGEVMLHNWGLSIVGYTGDDLTPTNNVKAISFFDDINSAITNQEKARARVWGGHDLPAEFIGSQASAKSILQLEIGVEPNGFIDSDDRARIALIYTADALNTYKRQVMMDGFDSMEITSRHVSGVELVSVSVPHIHLGGKTYVTELQPSSSGLGTVGTNTVKYGAGHFGTLYADSIIAPSFVGQNTIGTRLTVGAYFIKDGTWHTFAQYQPGGAQPWVAAHNDGFFSGGASTRMTADQQGWYRISYNVVNIPNRTVKVKVNGSYDVLQTWATDNAKTVASGDFWLQAGDYIELLCGPQGDTYNVYADFTMVRSGTMGAAPTSNVWDSAAMQYIRNTGGGAAELRVEGTGSMKLTVQGSINSEAHSFDGVDVAGLKDDFDNHLTAFSPHPQYLLRGEVGTHVASVQYVNEVAAAGIASGENIPHSTLLGLGQGDDHPMYVSLYVPRTIEVRHTFAPANGAPFLIGGGAVGNLVTGLNAEYLNGYTFDQLLPTSANVLAVLLDVDGAGSNLDADLLDGLQGSGYAKSAVVVGAGDGLIGGGTLGSSFSLAVGAGPGISVAADAVSLASSVAGEGLLYNTGVLSTNPALAGAGLIYNAGVLAVGQGFGIVVAADAIAVDVTAGYTWTGPHIFQSTLTARHVIPEATDTYDLGTSTYWWRQQYVSQINAAIFAIQTINLYDGWIMVPKDAGKLPAVAHGQLQINFGKPMTRNDFIVVRDMKVDGSPLVEYMQVGTLVSGTTYNVSRDKAGTGTTYNWPADTSYALLGQAGDGRVEINSYDTPRISVITQGAAYNVQTEVVRLGDINGMPGVTQQKWGIYIGTAGQYLKFDGTTLTIAGDGAGVTNIAGGNIQTGTITGAQLNLSSYLAINSNTFGSDGIQLQYNGGNPRAYIGDGANRYFKFDGSTITWKAANAELDASGNLIATNATLSGAITATSGSISGTLTIGSSGKVTAGNVTLNNTGISGLAGVGGLDTSSSWRFLDSGGVQVGILSATVPYSGTSGTTVTLESYAPAPATSTTLTLSARIAGATNYINIYPNKILLVSDTINAYTASGEKTIWHSGNLSISSFLRTDTSSQMYGGVLTVRVPDGLRGDYNGQINTLMIYQNSAGYDAMMTFHIGGDYAVHFGLDGTTNDLFVGGWSMGAGKKYRIFHAGQLGTNGNWWDRSTYVGADGVTEIGKYLDFHEADDHTGDYSARINSSGGTLNTSGGITANGTIYTTGQGNFGQLDVYSAAHYCGSFNAQGTTGNWYGYINLNYAGTRRGYLLWAAGGVTLTCDTNNALTLSSGGNCNTTIWSQSGTRFTTAYGYVDVGPQNGSYCHFQTDRANFYFDHTLVIAGNISSYNNDICFQRAGTNRLIFYTWGTYATQHFTIEDVFAMVNVQGSQPNQPASGCKVYVWASGGVTYLQARFANGTIRNLANS